MTWRNGTNTPRRRERRGMPVGSVPLPWPCPRCGSEMHSDSGFRTHLRTVHNETSSRAISLELDRFRYPGKAVAG